MAIKDVLNNFINNILDKEEIYLKVGLVKSVDENAKTFVFIPNTGETELEVAMTVIDGDSLYIMPKVNTTVIIGYTNNIDAYCLQVKEADKIIFNSENIIFNGGDNDGLININDLTSKLNGLVSKVNALYNLLKNWVVAPSDGGLALQTAAKLLTNADDFNKSDFEDEKITH